MGKSQDRSFWGLVGLLLVIVIATVGLYRFLSWQTDIRQALTDNGPVPCYRDKNSCGAGAYCQAADVQVLGDLPADYKIPDGACVPLSDVLQEYFGSEKIRGVNE